MNKFDFSFQNFADLWSKQQIKEFKFQAKLAYKKSQFIGKKIFRHDWKDEWKNMGSFYHANKAIFKGASKNLPFKTLTLLGELLSNSSFETEIQTIINQNVIKFEGCYFKLDDLEQQNKIRKALKTYKFQSPEKQAA